MFYIDFFPFGREDGQAKDEYAGLSYHDSEVKMSQKESETLLFQEK